MTKTRSDIEKILSAVRVGLFPNWAIHFGCSEFSPGGDAPMQLIDSYLQIVATDAKDNVTGAPITWRGRKWRLSPHMTETEIVNTALLAYHNAMEHELFETFTYVGRRIYDPHRSVDSMIQAADANHMDRRSPQAGVTSAT